MTPNDILSREQDAKRAKLLRTPAFMAVAGALPGIFAATTFENGIALAAVAIVTVAVLAIIEGPVRFLCGRYATLPVMLTVSVTVTTLLGYALRIVDPVVFDALGYYLPLTGVSALAALVSSGALGRADDGGRLPLGARVSRAACGACCAGLALAAVGLVASVLGTGEVLGAAVPGVSASPLAIFVKPSGALLVVALVAAVLQAFARERPAAPAPESPEGGER